MENGGPTVSIVVPVYNAAKYLRDNIKCICRQTYKDLEIIYVDDGSTDKTAVIIDDFSKKDKRIKYFYQKNQGAAGARNAGLSLASGKYIMFLDADDYFVPRMVEKLVDISEKRNADIVYFGYYFWDGYTKRPFEMQYPLENDVYNPKELSIDLFQRIHCVPWNKIIKTEYVKSTGILFQNQKSVNDLFFSFAVTVRATGISFCNELLMYYNIANNDSLQHLQKSGSLYGLYAVQKLGEYLKSQNLYQTYSMTYMKFLGVMLHSIFTQITDEKQLHDTFSECHDIVNNILPPTGNVLPDDCIYGEELNCIISGDFTKFITILYVQTKADLYNMTSKDSISYKIGYRIVSIIKRIVKRKRPFIII